MYEVTVLNLETGETFREPFKSLYFLEQFKRKCKYSKKTKNNCHFKNLLIT